MPETLLRVLITVGVTCVIIVAFLVFKNFVLTSNRGKALQFQKFKKGTPAIILFSSPTCVPCKMVQKPAIEKVKEKLGDKLQFLEIDATKDPKLAQEWGVVSVPTTYVIESDGRSKFVHFGIVTEKILIQQIQEIL